MDGGIGLSIDPVSGKPRRTSESAENKIERKINPEDEKLPDGASWGGRVAAAGLRRWDQANLWRTTLADRAAASLKGAAVHKHEARENDFSRRSNEFAKREAGHTKALARLENRSGIWNLPIARQITGLQVVFHSWRERTNRQKGARADANAAKFADRAALAQKRLEYFDGKIASKVDTITKRWDAKLDKVRGPRERIDERVGELQEELGKQEVLIAKIKSGIDALENATGGDKKARREKLGKLRKALTNEEIAFENNVSMFRNAHKHRIRVAGAYDSGEMTINLFRKRYEDHEAWKKPEDTTPGTTPETGTTTDTTPTSPEPAEELTWSLRDLAETKGEITNQQIEKLWNNIFKDAKLPDGHKTLTKLMKTSFPDWTVNEGATDKIEIKNFLNRLEQLFDTSPTFKKFAEQAASQRGDKAIQTVVGRLESRLALIDNLDEI